MKYALLLYHANWPTEPSPEGLAAWEAYTAELQEAGLMVDAAALQPAPTAFTVRQTDDVLVTTDGPFAETKEQLRGYYVIDVAGPDDAAAWAARVPSVAFGGSVEVRQVMEFD